MRGYEVVFILLLQASYRLDTDADATRLGKYSRAEEEVVILFAPPSSSGEAPSPRVAPPAPTASHGDDAAGPSLPPAVGKKRPTSGIVENESFRMTRHGIPAIIF